MKSGENFLTNLLDRLLPNRAAPVLARVLKVHEGPGVDKYSCDVQVLKAGSLEETDQIISEVPINPVWASKENKGLYSPPPEGGVVIVGFLEWNVAFPYVQGVYSNKYNAQKFEKDKFILTDGKDLRFEFSDDEILLHDTNGFEMRFIKGIYNLVNDEGLNFEIDSEEKTFLFFNGEESWVKVEPDIITADNGKISAVLNNDKCSIKNESKSLFTIIDNIVQHVHDMTTNGSPNTHIVSPSDKQLLLQDKSDWAELMEA